MAGKRGPGRPKGSNHSSSRNSKRGRKPIFSEAQKRVLNRMICASLKSELKTLVKAL
ncbi:MAG: hypothetical protein HY291_11955 [Planctomycetes bacterium]|nr:hypothetical protein [Planctomycetota bacterium]